MSFYTYIYIYRCRHKYIYILFTDIHLPFEVWEVAAERQKRMELKAACRHQIAKVEDRKAVGTRVGLVSKQLQAPTSRGKEVGRRSAELRANCWKSLGPLVHCVGFLAKHMFNLEKVALFIWFLRSIEWNLASWLKAFERHDACCTLLQDVARLRWQLAELILESSNCKS